MKKGVKVWSLIVILMFVTSVFGGVVSAENVSEDLTKSVADGEIQTVVDNISSAELAKYNIVLDEDQLRSDLSSSQSCTLYAIADGYAWSGGTENPSGASSTADELRVGFRTAAGNYRTLIKFDLSSIPAGATITSADLKLYYHLYSGTAGDPLDISVYRTTVDWNEGYLSWSKAENYNSFSYDTVTIIAGSGANYKAWDITALVQNWIDGTYSNYGVLLRAPTQSGFSIYRQFRSKEYGSNVPKLEVTFTTEQELLPAPTLISPYNGETGVSTTPYFDWSSVSGATHYWLMVAENENDLPDDPSAETCPNCVISEASLTSTSYTTSTALAEGTTYYWQVQAYEWGGSSVTRQGQFSQHYSFTTEESLLPAPSLYSPADNAPEVSTTPYFDWSSVSGATHYWLMVAENENDLPDDPSAETCPNCVISEASLTSTSYTTSTALAEGTTYYWQVQAYEWGGSSVTRQGQFSQHWTFTTEEESALKVKGIDVSSYQGNIDWAQVYTTGYRFAFAKATEGDDKPPQIIDDYFEVNMNNGQNAGMLMGAYHFAHPEVNNAVDEALFFVIVANDYLSEGYLRPVLDLESGAALGKTALSNWVHEWMNTVKSETGIEPIIYVNSNYANNYLDSSIAQYDLWIAHWTYDPDASPNTGIWSDWDFWQYSDKGSVSGIGGDVDLDLFNGDMSSVSTF